MALPNKAKIPVGTVLAGKYRITREIGRGGMAAVYEAANVDIGKRVAIKVLAQELTTSAVVVERFLREARAAAAIRSPYICDIYDSGKLDDGRPFLVLELLEGESLYERMTKIRWLDVETTCSIIIQTCRGLTKAHAASIVHRDLKPENIFLTKDEEGELLAKILDFGLAKFYAPMGGGGPQARLTREGAVFGTPAYMSPEQVRGQGAVDHRADLWALGCIVYECFTGRTVWSTEQGVAMTFAQIANAPLPRPATYRPDLPLEFTGWFDRALDRNIEKRFQTAKEFADELAFAFNHERPSAIRSAASLLQGAPSNPFLESAPASAVAKPYPPPGGQPEVQQATPGHDGAASGPKPRAPKGPEAETEPPPAKISAPSSEGSAATAAPGQDGPTPPPASPRPSKLGFVSTEPREPGEVAPQAPRAHSPIRRVAMIGGGVALAGGAAFAVWTQIAEPPPRPPPAASASASASVKAPPVATDAGVPSPPPVAEAPSPSWMTYVRDGQQAIAAGDLKQAQKLFKEAFDKGGGHGVPRTMLEHVAVAAGTPAGSTCRLTGLARPRFHDLASSARPPAAGRPSIAVGPKGAVITWTDAHEGAEHAYTAALDDAMRDQGVPVDVTPEGSSINRPELRRAGEKLVLSYWDAKGLEAGIKARFLEPDGRIAGPAVAVSPPSTRGGSNHPSLAIAPDGSFYVAWSDEADTDSEDLFLRHLGPGLEFLADPVRVTDLVPAGPSKARARFPSLAVPSDAILLSYRLERDPLRVIHHLRLPRADAGKGLEPAKKNDKHDSRSLGDVALVNTDKSKTDSPVLSCGGGFCFVVWHGESNGGASAAFIEPSKTQPLWRKKFSRTGGHPAVAVAPSGQAQVVWYEGGKVLTAPITRDGVGQTSRIARVSGEQPAPSIVAGQKPGEWYVAWLDYETGHLEAYAARIACK
jgi:serine/threonine-protein kinase